MPIIGAGDSASAPEAPGAHEGILEVHHQKTRLKTSALQDAIFNSAYFSSIATDEHGVIQIFNVGAARMLGYDATDVVNKITPADISDPQELIARAKALSAELATPIEPGFESLVFKASRGIEDIYELTYIRKDGSRFPAVVSVTALRDEQDAIIGYLLIGTDNTARKQVEAEQKKLDQRIRDQQFYTRSLIESNIDALMTTDPAGIITDVNKQMEALTGCTRDELIGAPFKNYFTDPDRAEAGIRLVLSEKKVTNYELTARARDGTEVVVSYNATTFYDRDRSLQGVFAAARDVTELKHFERRLQEKNLELEKASRMKSEFLATMSHELRTPLTGMLGMLELLGLTPLDGEQAETLQIARDSGHGLVRIINDVLDHAKIEAGKLEISIEPVSISRLLRQVLNTWQAVANAGDLMLMQSVDPRISPSLLADPLRVSQILNNLVSNGLKFTLEGHVEVSAQLLSRTDTTETISLSVRDTGIGIDPEVQKRLFQPFEQAGAATALLYGGTGLGLSICRRLAELMGGTIMVDSKPGKGTTMCVVLTLDISAEGALAEDGTKIQTHVLPIFTADVQGNVPVVLAVDDHPTNRALLTRQLLALGLRVNTAVDGVDALARWRKGGIALIITDCNMPQMDGYEFTRAIRLAEAQEGRDRTRVIAWTANVLPGTTEQCLAADMDAILIKPASLATLKDILEDWLPVSLMSMLRQADASGAEIQGRFTLHELDKLAANADDRAEILLDFMIQTRANTLSLAEELQREDLPACMRICHRMKGAGGMVGARDLVVACTVAEQAARAGKLARTITAKAAIDLALARLEVHLADTSSTHRE